MWKKLHSQYFKNGGLQLIVPSVLFHEQERKVGRHTQCEAADIIYCIKKGIRRQTV